MSCSALSRRAFAAALLFGMSAWFMHGEAAAEKPAAGAEPSEAVLTFKRSGGFAGFNDNLTIYANSTYTNNDGESGFLNDEQQKVLDKLLATFGKVDWSHSDGPNVADGMSVSISIRGSGEKTTLKPRDGEFREIQELATSLLRPMLKK
jgi:hypothetical protein